MRGINCANSRTLKILPWVSFREKWGFWKCEKRQFSLQKSNFCLFRESVAEFRSNFELDYIHRTANYSPEYERNLVAELVQALQNRIRETRQYFDHGILT